MARNRLLPATNPPRTPLTAPNWACRLTSAGLLGVRLAGPVHFANNELADSATDPQGAEWKGLSEKGRAFVAEANRLGIVLDASHAPDEALDQMITLSKAPVLLSHSGLKAAFDHPRNIGGELRRKLADREAMVASRQALNRAARCGAGRLPPRLAA